MNKSFGTVLLLLVTATLASPYSDSATLAQTPATAAQASQKVIKDPAEYNAYIAALNEPDSVKKAALIEAFVQRYPQSVVRIEGLENAMAAYQQAGNVAKVQDVAQRIIAIDPANVRALAILAYLKRAAGTLDAAKEGQVYAERGLTGLAKWTRPDETTEADFQKQRTQMEFIFYGAAGFGALQNKQYSVARDYYVKALAIDASSLQDAYQAGIAELSMTPQDLTGFWHIAKAQSLAQSQNNADGAKAIGDYGKGQYKRYHGNDDGWDAFAARATAQSAPPALAELQKAITPKPTSCEIAVQAVNDAVKGNSLNELSFGDYEFVLQQRDCSPAATQAADTIWAFIQGKQKNGEVKLKLVGLKVIAVTRGGLDAALTEENQSSNLTDLHVSFTSPLAILPAVGSMVDITGVITGYTPNPFLFKMDGVATASASGPAPK